MSSRQLRFVHRSEQAWPVGLASPYKACGGGKKGMNLPSLTLPQMAERAGSRRTTGLPNLTPSTAASGSQTGGGRREAGLPDSGSEISPCMAPVTQKHLCTEAAIA